MRQALEEELEDLLHHHQGLRDLKERRKREEIQSQMQDTRSLEAILENLIKQHRTLATCSWLGCARQTPSSPPRSAGRSKLSQVLDALPDPGSRRHPILELLTTSGHFWLMIAIHERSAPKPRPGRRRRCFSRRFQPNHQAGHFGQGRLAKCLAPGLVQDRHCARLVDGLTSPSVVAPKSWRTAGRPSPMCKTKTGIRSIPATRMASHRRTQSPNPNMKKLSRTRRSWHHSRMNSGTT